MGSKPVVPVLLEGLQKLEYRGTIPPARSGAGRSPVDPARLRQAHKPGSIAGVPSSERAVRHRAHAMGHARAPVGGKCPSASGLLGPYRPCSQRHHRELSRTEERFAEGGTRVQERNRQRGYCPSRGSTSAWQVARGGCGKCPAGSCAAANAICLIASDAPQTIIAARNGPSLILGLGEGEWLIASRYRRCCKHTQRVHFMRDGEMAVISAAGVRLLDSEGRSCPLLPQEIRWSRGWSKKQAIATLC